MVSVLIPTYNGEKKIANILASLAKQTYSDFEIIIGVDGSTDNTIEFIKRQQKIRKNKIEIFYQENAGRSVIRNNIAKIAKSDLLIFYDDDMMPLPDSVEKHIEFHNNYKKSILVANPIDKHNKVSDFLRYKEYLSKKWLMKYNSELVKMNKNNLFLTAANFSIEKSLFTLLQGFDEQLTDAEDWDLAVRAFEKNIPLYFDATNIAYHTDALSCKMYIERQRNYYFAQKKLDKHKKDLYGKYNNRSHNPSKSVFKLFIYFLIANKISVYLIDNNIIKFFPKRIKYRFYDIVVTGLSKIFSNRKL